MKEVKYSRQREAILNCLMHRHDHPTADAIYHTIRLTDPKISLGTVYRNLGLLTELGQVRKISCGDGIERYDYKTYQHYHFVCNCCNAVFDVEPEMMDPVHNSVNHPDIGEVESHSLIFYGKCKACKEK